METQQTEQKKANGAKQAPKGPESEKPVIDAELALFLLKILDCELGSLRGHQDRNNLQICVQVLQNIVNWQDKEVDSDGAR